jgi:hypothetical protein
VNSDKVALFRNGLDLRDVRLTSPERTDELLQFARKGDTLHNIPELLTHSSEDVLRCVKLQLETGHFVPV